MNHSDNGDSDRESDRESDDERWLIVNGRRWRRTNPCLPTDVVEALTLVDVGRLDPNGQ